MNVEATDGDIQGVLHEHGKDRAELIAILREVQESLGYLSGGAVRQVRSICRSPQMTCTGRRPSIRIFDSLRLGGIGSSFVRVRPAVCGACRVSVSGKTKLACVDGPFFDGYEVDWDELFSRRGAYAKVEIEAMPQQSCEMGAGAT